LLSKLFVYASGKEAVLDLTNLFSFHLAPDNIGLDAEIDLVEQYILLSRLQMEMGEKEKGKLFLKGKLGLTEPPIIEVEGQLSSIPLSMAKSLWPEALTPRVRAWVVKNVNGGEISGGTVKLDIQKNDWENIYNKQALRPEMIQLAFTLSDTNIQYLPTLPPLQKLRGNALLSATTFDAWVAQATVYPDEESQGVSISSGRFSVDKFQQANANVDTNIIGIGEDILTFISKKPLSLLKRFPISPKNVQGRVEGKINIRFPIKKAMKLSDVQVNVSAESKALRINNIFPGKSLSDGQITLQADRKALSVQGVGALEGIVSRFQWEENFTSPSGQGSKIRIIGAFNGNDLARLGLNIAKGRIRDKAETDITLEGGLGIWRRGEASINLTGVEFFAYPFSWMKPPHEQAQLKAELSFFNQKKKLKTIELQIIGENANLNGKIEFLEDGRIETMKFDPFELGEKNSGIIEISTRQNIVYTTLNARHFDASYFLKLKKPKEFRGGKFNINAYLGDNVEYDFTIENLHANNNVSAINVSGKASYVKKRYEIAGVSAYVEENKKKDSILLSLVRKTPELRELTITSPNASHILRAMDIIPGMRGGDLTINVALGEESSSGEMLIENFAVRDVPFFGKLLALGSLTAMADALYRDGMEFRVAKMQFENNPKQANLTRFYAYGTGVGVTLKGKINWQKKTLSMNGDIIPAYTLNSIFSSIPILGPLLIGDKGLLGISYKINGNLSAPELNVNPLSLLAPGRFRQIFEVFSTRPVPQKGHGFRKNRRMIPKNSERKESANP
ncbi:MAG: AsmA-like C-terminal domain-containing protein, partial [Parvibaculales bacterium]